MDQDNQTIDKQAQLAPKIRLGAIVLLFAIIAFFAGRSFPYKNQEIGGGIEEMMYQGSILDKYGDVRKESISQDIDFDLFWDVWDSVKDYYVDKGEINEKEMFYGAIRGMVASVGDPYTVYMDPKLAEEFNNDLSGTFEGIGAEIGIRDEVLTIIAPLEGMPAEAAGLLPGDKVLAINDEPTMDITIDEAVSKIRGPKGTQVTLTIYREGAEETKNLTITRGLIYVKSVKTEMRDDGWYVVRVSNFNGDTMDLFNQAVSDILAKNPKGLILDLRSNTGGYLDTAIEMASEWVEDGLIVIEKGADGEEQKYESRGRARLKDYKTVILVNEGTASASEIVAGALHDYNLATIVGMKTFGKGSVQQVRNFFDGSAIKITVAKWLTPNGTSINEEGIAPDVEVDIDVDAFLNDGKDAQMEKAIEILNQ